MRREVLGILISIMILVPVDYSFSQEEAAATGAAGGGGGGEAAVVTGAEGYVSQLTKIRNTAKVYVGMSVGYKPFEFKNEKGEIVGFDIDIAQELAKALGAELVIKNYVWEDLRKNLGGEINLIISGMSRTLERAFYVNFADPYFQTGQVVIVSARSAVSISTVSELDNKDKKIIVVGGTTGEDLANKKFPKAKIISVLNEDEAVKGLSSGQVDAFLFDKPFIEYLAFSYPKMKILLPQLSYESYCFAIPKGDLDFLLWLNYFIDELKISGKYKEIYSKWFKS